MNIKVLLCIFALCLNYASAQTKCSTDDDAAFATWELDFNKKYLSANERQKAKEVFCLNKADIDAHNLKKGKDFTRSIFEYSDLSTDEKSDMLTGLIIPNNVIPVSLAGVSSEINFTKISPHSLNYTELGYVNEVQDQGRCGSCWAFSANGALEGQLKKKFFRIPKISEQELVDCTAKYTGQCKGGYMAKVYDYIQENRGISYSYRYLYEAKVGPCRSSKTNTAFAFKTIKAITIYALGRENLVRDYLYNIGPLSISIDSHLPSFYSYSSGIFNDPNCGNGTGHAVVLTGYGTDAKTGLDYWIIKNSWGRSWGEQGYMRLARNKNSMCGIGRYVTYPEIN